MSDLKSLRPLEGLDRRGFMTSALVGGFAAAALPISATTITTDTAGLETGETRIPVSDGELPAYFSPLTGWPYRRSTGEDFRSHPPLLLMAIG